MGGALGPESGATVGRSHEPSASDLRRWRKYLVAERAEAAVYRDLGARRSGEEREILLALADAEGRHEQHWRALLGDNLGAIPRVDLRTRMLSVLAGRFGTVFVLALAQRAESRSPYEADSDATDAMAADERIHEEVVRGLAARGRLQLAGTFRAAVFGINDGLVSNLALVIGMSATGVGNTVVLAAGIAGLLAGALSMGAGEYVSVQSQRELLAASEPSPRTGSALAHLDLEANELTLVYRARGMSLTDAEERAQKVLRALHDAEAPDAGDTGGSAVTSSDASDAVGSGWAAAVSSFCFFASGALLPVLPYLFGFGGWTAIGLAVTLVGLALFGTGGMVGILSGASPVRRATRQLLIGLGAAAVTYCLGLLFGTVLG